MNRKIIKSILVLVLTVGVALGASAKAAKIFAVTDPGDPPRPVAPLDTITSMIVPMVSDPGDPPRP